MFANLLIIIRNAEDGDVLGESSIDHDCVAAGEFFDFFDAPPFDQHILARLGQDSGSCGRRFPREQAEHDGEAVDDAVLFGLTGRGAAAYSLAVDDEFGVVLAAPDNPDEEPGQEEEQADEEGRIAEVCDGGPACEHDHENQPEGDADGKRQLPEDDGVAKDWNLYRPFNSFAHAGPALRRVREGGLPGFCLMGRHRSESRFLAMAGAFHEKRGDLTQFEMNG